MRGITTLLILFLSSIHVYSQKTPLNEENLGDSPKERIIFEKELVKDPISGEVPVQTLVNEYINTKNRVKKMISSGMSGVTWHERGPNNIGGRVRTLMFDPNDAQHKRIWAGGVAGGIWYNNDITSAGNGWTKIDDFWDNLAVTTITYDPNKTNVFYVGTGEGWFNADAVLGGGVWKSTNGGTNWSLLTSTIPSFSSSATHIQYAFQTIQKIVVGGSSKVFAGTQSGIWSSTDDGVTWSLNLLPNPASNSSSNNYCSDLEVHNGVIYAGFGRGTGSSIYKSTDNGVTWTNITPPNISGGRTELAVGTITINAPTDVIYAASDDNFSALSYLKKSIDGGTTWTDLTIPNATDGSLSPDVTNGQAWYDLILAVHPDDGNVVFIGGASHARSIDGGASWYCFTYWNDVHPDHHYFAFRPNDANSLIMANDGGVYYSSNYSDKTVVASSTAFDFATRNTNLNITQPYSVAIKNVSNDGYVLHGNQDNGTVKTESAYNTIGAGIEVLGGDGMLCFIDQDNAGYQFGTTQYNNFYMFDANGNITQSLTPKYGGLFVNPSDYKSDENILFSLEGAFNYGGGVYYTDIARYVITGSATHTYSYFSMSGSYAIRFIKAGLTPNTVYVGTSSGYVYKLSNITDVDNMVPTMTTVLAPSQVGGETGTISCIEFGASENEIIVTKSNYNLKSVLYTTDAGATWTSKDEVTHGLANIPVRYALFNPLNRKQVLIATQLGVWSTTDITASNPGWQPTNANLANVRCDMLRYRSSDNTIAVATHGRGVFTTKLVVCNSDIVRNSSETVSETILSGSYIKGNTNNVIQTGVNKTYSAKTYILLEPKFETSSNSIFTAIIGGCSE